MAYRELDKLQPEFKKKVDAFLKEVGDKIFITESWRSQTRQNKLYEYGRTLPGPKRTRTRNSMHTKGLAIDIAFKGPNLYPREEQKRLEIYKVAKKYGIDNLRENKRLEKPHLQDNGKPMETKKYEITEEEKNMLIKIQMNANSIMYNKIENEEYKQELQNLMSRMNEIYRKLGFNNK